MNVPVFLKYKSMKETLPVAGSYVLFYDKFTDDTAYNSRDADRK